ncbi:tRNA adenosine(34) deaminase TadA [Legionella dresdenensis]|uniref:tRNA-specific adenosine deaminase n=1 Tax=Legionella dresdenensis TaxID=450200 RepID=A0ABV8CGZ0_9GAMM
MGIKNDSFWMEKAYQQALKAKEDNEVPVGAVLVDADNCLIGQGYNQVLQDNDPCAHAEILAIRQAAKTVGNFRLNNTTLYVTLEPCAMCAGAIVHARIKRLVFAARDFKAGAAGSVYNLLRGFPLNHQVQIDEGNMQEPCARLLTEFFRNK